jgi:hypothetical protein
MVDVAAEVEVEQVEGKPASRLGGGITRGTRSVARQARIIAWFLTSVDGAATADTRNGRLVGITDGGGDTLETERLRKAGARAHPPDLRSSPRPVRETGSCQSPGWRMFDASSVLLLS